MQTLHSACQVAATTHAPAHRLGSACWTHMRWERWAAGLSASEQEFVSFYFLHVKHARLPQSTLGHGSAFPSANRRQVGSFLRAPLPSNKEKERMSM